MVARLPLVLAAAVPAASSRLLPALGRWMTDNNRWIQVVAGFGFLSSGGQRDPSTDQVIRIEFWPWLP
jgi:hypothetical protein